MLTFTTRVVSGEMDRRPIREEVKDSGGGAERNAILWEGRRIFLREITFKLVFECKEGFPKQNEIHEG